MWGTLAVSFTHDSDLLAQLAGVAAVGAFVFATSLLVWWVIDVLLGVRNPPHVEQAGQDLAELGIVAYPEFMLIDDVEPTRTGIRRHTVERCIPLGVTTSSYAAMSSRNTPPVVKGESRRVARALNGSRTNARDRSGRIQPVLTRDGC